MCFGYAQGLSGTVDAVPTCPSGVEDCSETSNYTIVPRRLPLAPSLDVPRSIGASSPNSFTSTSLMVSPFAMKKPTDQFFTCLPFTFSSKINS